MNIIILHGLYMNGLVMQPLGYKLRSLGHQTKVLTYNTVAINDQRIFSQIDNALSETEPNILVGHSLGGVVIKRYLQSRQPSSQSISHVVLIASPIKGASIVTRLQELKIDVILGNAPTFGLNQHEDEWSFEQKLGCIAGTLPLGVRPFLLMDNSPLSDGTVTVEETKIEGMTDHITVKSSHTSLIYSSQVPKLIEHFIYHNQFPAN